MFVVLQIQETCLSLISKQKSERLDCHSSNFLYPTSKTEPLQVERKRTCSLCREENSEVNQGQVDKDTTVRMMGIWSKPE